MGNVLRGDDGFGIRVIDELKQNHKFTDDVDLYEAGIGVISLVLELMNGYDALIVIDAVEKGAEPGTVFVLEPMDGNVSIQNLELHQKMVDMHYADPSKVLLMAKAVNVCPPIVYIVGCQPEFVDEAEEGLHESVENAVPQAITEVNSLIEQLQKT